MAEGFLEVVFPIRADFDLDDRDDFEAWIDGLLSRGDFGEVSGAGIGEGVTSLDLTIFKAEHTGEVIEALLKLLKDRKAPMSTIVYQRAPEQRVYRMEGANGILN